MLHAGVMRGVLQAVQVLKLALHFPVVFQVLQAPVYEFNLVRL